MENISLTYKFIEKLIPENSEYNQVTSLKVEH